MGGTEAMVQGTYTPGGGYSLDKITVSIRVVGGGWSNPAEASVDTMNQTWSIGFGNLDPKKKYEVQVIGHWLNGMDVEEIPGNQVEIPYEESSLRSWTSTPFLCLYRPDDAVIREG
jgi:hypothetical protein